MKRYLFGPIGVWALLLMLSGAVILNSHFVADMSAFLPRNPSEQQQILVDQLTRGPLSRTLLMGIRGGTLDQRLALSRALANTTKVGGNFKLISNGEGDDNTSTIELLTRYRYLLSPQVTPEHFEVSGLHTAFEESIVNLSSSLGSTLKKVFTRDPTGELFSLLSEFNMENRPNSIEGVWFSKDGERAILLGVFNADGGDIDAQERLLQDLRDVFAKQQTEQNAPNCSLMIAGPAVYAVESRHAIKTQVTTLSLIGTTGVMLLLLLAFRSLRAMAVCILPVLSATIVGTAVVSLVFGTVHGITVGFGSTLIGEAVDYSIYFFIQSQTIKAAASLSGQQGWLKSFWPTIRLGTLTSVCGFTALLFAGFPGLSQLGVFSIAGLTTAALTTRFVLPNIHVNAKPFEISQHLSIFISSALAALQSLPRYVLGLATVALVVLLTRQAPIWTTTLSSLSPISSSSSQVDQILRGDLGAPQMRYLMVVQGASQETVLQGAEAVSTALKPLQAAHEIEGFESPSRLIPSEFTQRARQAALPTPNILEQRVHQALSGLPIRNESLAPFIEEVNEARTLPLLRRDMLGNADLAISFDALMMQTEKGVTAFLPVHQTTESRSLATALTEVANIAQSQMLEHGQPSVHISFIDIAEESVQVYSGYFKEIMVLSMIGLGVITLLLAASLRSSQRVLAVLLPLLISILFVMTANVLAGETMTLLHLVGLLLTVALGSNYALFFNRTEVLDTKTLSSLLLANTSTMIGFGVLAFSNVPVLHALGVTVAPGAFLSLLLAATFSSQRHPRSA